MTNWPLVATLLQICWLLGVSVWLLLERRSPTATIAWIFALTFLPVIGVPVYLTFGPRRLHRRRLRRSMAKSAVVSGFVPIGAVPDPVVKRFLPDSENLRQIIALSVSCGEAPPARVRNYTIYTEGEPLYLAMEETIRSARRHLHIANYIWEPDRTGTRFRDLLGQRARDGVKVRVLVDALGSHRAIRTGFFAPLRDAGAEVATFNPVRLARIRERYANFRNHRKILVADGTIGYTGGLNIADYHTSKVVGSESWRDTHLLIEGDAVRWLQFVFLEDWYFATDLEIPTEGLFPKSPPEGEQLVQIVSSGPDQATFPIHRLFFTAISSARERILLTSPYFVPDEPIMTALITAARRGVMVQVLVPKKPDHRVLRTAARTYYDELSAENVEVRTYGPRMIHAKTLVIDRQLAIIGSANMDNRSFRLNFEVVAALYGEEPASRLASIFRDDLRSSEPFEPRKRTPMHIRFVESLARLFSPIL